MKKLYHKGTVHPSPPAISDQLSFLPEAILTLAVALSPEDREVLAYLLFCSSANFSGNSRRSSNGGGGGGGGCVDHAPQFNCSCFRCYTSYWVRWDESPNRQRIHEIIDAFEEWLAKKNNKKGGGSGKKEKRNNKKASKKHSPESKRSELTSSPSTDSAESESVGDINRSGDDGGGDGAVAEEKGSVRKFVSFIGERIWGAWGQ